LLSRLLDSFSAVKAGVEFMVVFYRWFVETPAEVDITAVSLAKKVDKTGVQVFDDAAIGTDLFGETFDGDEVLNNI
jgi:hypothetical protein